MGCFLVPATLGIFTTAYKKKVPKNLHIGWLNTMIWGGSAALLIEHIAHQEIVPWFPFLTTMGSPAEFASMIGEMMTVGVGMTLAIVAVWGVMVTLYEKMKTTHKSATKSTA